MLHLSPTFAVDNQLAGVADTVVLAVGCPVVLSLLRHDAEYYVHVLPNFVAALSRRAVEEVDAAEAMGARARFHVDVADVLESLAPEVREFVVEGTAV